MNVEFPKPFTVGSEITVHGHIPKGADRDRVHIDLNTQSVDGRKPDIALFINARFDETVILRNSEINGSWGAEERSGGFTLTTDSDFSCTITVNTDAYKLKVNGVDYGNYVHRIPPEKVTSIAVHGAIEAEDVTFVVKKAPAFTQ